MNKLLIVLVMFSIAGCSNKAIYNNIRLNERNKCFKEPQKLYFECVDRTSKSYEEYERERKEMLQTQKKIDAENSKESMEIHEE